MQHPQHTLGTHTTAYLMYVLASACCILAAKIWMKVICDVGTWVNAVLVPPAQLNFLDALTGQIALHVYFRLLIWSCLRR